jgi:hypothetical protein
LADALVSPGAFLFALDPVGVHALLFCDHLKSLLSCQQRAQAAPDDGMIIDDENASDAAGIASLWRRTRGRRVAIAHTPTLVP